MNKKKGTILGIIVLLLCTLSIIAASYAYYSVVMNGTGGTTAVTSTSEKVGNVSLSGDSALMHIRLKPSDISNAAGGNFYATSGEDDYKLSEETLEIAKIEATSNPANVTYNCSFDIKVTPKDNSLSSVNGGDILLTHNGISITGLTNDKISYNTLNGEKVYHAAVTLTSGNSFKVLVSSKISSSSINNNESWLSNINGEFNVTANNLKCNAGGESLVKPELTLTKATGNTGSTAEVGDTITVGTEDFYVISNNGSKINMLSKYNLNVGGEYTSAYSSYGTVTNVKQSSDYQGWTSNGTPYKGVTAFSNSNYWNETNTEIYNNNSLLFAYIETYVNKLNSENNGLNASGRLILKSEVEALINGGNELSGGLINTLSGVANKTWIYSTSYWTGTSFSSTEVWRMTSNSHFYYSSHDYKNYYGVRPVLTISSNLI